eukprot:3928275-Amphidinium_carterae.2
MRTTHFQQVSCSEGAANLTQSSVAWHPEETVHKTSDNYQAVSALGLKHKVHACPARVET